MDKSKSRDRLFTGVVLVITGLLGLSSGAGMYGTMGGMMGGGMMGQGYAYSPVSLLITLVFLGVTALGVYLVYDAVKKE